MLAHRSHRLWPAAIPALQLTGAVVALLAASSTACACSSCGCNLSPDWVASNGNTGAGVKLDLRYDYLNQSQLRQGTHRISPQAASQVVNDGEPQEVEQYTRNHYFTAALDYSPQPDWGVNLQLPYVSRSHSTLGNASDGVTAGADGGQFHSHTSSLGDVKVLGRYLGLTPARNLAVIAGLKLATGSHTKTGTSTDPGAPGAVDIDRGLQPGTGTTDAIVGLTYSGSSAPSWDYFVQGLFQTALHSRDDYRPGNGLNLNAGWRYLGLPSVQPQVQINVRHAGRDSGANADVPSSGGTLLYVSPGLAVPLGNQTSVYGYVQLPLYQDVKGVQLVPRFTASIGLRHAF